uniref:Elongation of very long chain fatty acids protein n=1 Tax=Parastrongyloides trichosuri TaxID=131310 RepID=A0A0N5A3N8_PARTI
MTSGDSIPYVSMTDILFAKQWSNTDAKYFMSHWVPTCAWISLAYVVVVFGGQRIMKNRQPFDLQNFVGFWNLGFSIFSAIDLYFLGPELYNSIKNTGFFGSYCYNGEYYTGEISGYWGWIFVMSKLPELGDTILLILRKKPVIFMHWYHHALTFYYAALTYSESQAWARWSLVMNLFVHTIMYFYFGTSAFGKRYPNIVRQFITSIQLIQFIISCGIFSHLVYIMSFGNVENCNTSWNVLIIGGFMYVSYLYLFAQFFYKAYIAPKKVSAKVSKKSN